MRRPGKVLVAASARTAAGDERPLSRPDQVMPRPVLLDQHLRARRNVDLQRLAAGAVPQRAAPVAAALGLEVRAAAKYLEISQRVVTDQHNVAATPPVPAVRPTLR